MRNQKLIIKHYFKMEHSFSQVIRQILQRHFGENASEIFDKSLLLQYINLKTKSANRGSKSRSSFASLYAIYVIVEDYIGNNFHVEGDYSIYTGAVYTNLMKKQKELPFGQKLQNHALNNRMNSEFAKFFPTVDYIPIIRNLETKRYWFNENLLKVNIGETTYNIAPIVIEIIDEYIKTKQDAFQRFIASCESLQTICDSNPEDTIAFIVGLLAPNIDARLFEIVSYSILKYYYSDQSIIWGFDEDNLTKEELKLYKTGRTNANDGGIDFVMKPLGRFFQVTETLDFKKYFLDIEKIEKYPISFVIKSVESEDELYARLKQDALKKYPVASIVDKYMGCIEEIINIPKLKKYLEIVIEIGYLNNVLEEIILQSKVEFNYDDEEEVE